MRYLLILALFCVGCADSGYKTVELPFRAAELAEHISLFERVYGVSINYTVQLGQLDANTVAVCKMWSSGKREVVVNIDYYEQYIDTPNFMEQTIFHELGHCTLNLGHRSERLDNGQPKSIMYPYAFGSSLFYANNKDYYYDELLDNSQMFVASKLETAAENEPSCIQHMD
jgi:hypothetical protein